MRITGSAGVKPAGGISLCDALIEEKQSQNGEDRRKPFPPFFFGAAATAKMTPAL
jgi:hypothetical protein